MAPSPLDGARLKIVRAEEHVESLKAEIAMYLKGRPWRIGTEKHGDITVPVPIITSPPPLRFSTIIGDCVNNLRAALDYVLWELVVRYFSPPFDVTDYNDRRITAFPISISPTDQGHINRLNGLAQRKVPAAAIDEIKLAQPYNAGHESLRWLHELVNTDKHRMPILMLAYVPVFTWFGDLEGNVGSYGGQLKTYRDASGKEAVEVDNQVTIYVTFQDVTMPREPVDRTLEQIIKTVADIVPRFNPFLA